MGLIFEVDFNRENIGTDEQLELIGAYYDDEYMLYVIELDDFGDLAVVHQDVIEKLGHEYFLIIGFDSIDDPYLYIDKYDKD